MVSYTTKEFYNGTYLQGRTAVIGTADFPAYALKATQEIKRYTGSNVDETAAFPDELQMCCCEVAEAIRKAEKSSHDGISSEKVGEYSVSYESQSNIDDKLQNDIRKIVYSWLAMTGLLYRGCS
jgi:hypothetical protein